LNNSISSANANIDSAAWPEKHDLKLMRNMVGKALDDTNRLEKEKKLQNMYLERLKKDVSMAEKELAKLALTAASIKQ